MVNSECCCYADALHAYFGVCGLSLMGEVSLEPINAALNITQRAADNMARVHAYWRGTVRGAPSLVDWCSPVHVATHVAYLHRALSSLGSNMQQADVIRYVAITGVQLVFVVCQRVLIILL